MKVKEIEPELTAEEIVQWFVEHYTDGIVMKEVFEHNYSMDVLVESFTPDEIVSKIAKWKANHEKKPPQIETVDICRIQEILPDGRKRCVHEEDIKPDPDLPYGGERLAAEDILRRYCMEHEGVYRAVHEVISRVKAVE